MIKKLLITSIALYVAFAGIRGCQAVRSPETKQVISYLESTAYLGQKVNEDHPEFFHEIKKDSSLEDETENIDDFKYNIAVIQLRELFDSFEKEISRKDYESALKLLAPFCPHIAEELWEKMGNKKFISLESSTA